jgi:hypothetical protein
VTYLSPLPIFSFAMADWRAWLRISRETWKPMTIDLLIQCIVQQTTVLIAQLATAGGARAPLAQIANQIFLDLVSELNRQGVGRKVTADMFGMGLRTFQRKIQRVMESTTDRGQSLWAAVLDYICAQKITTRASIQARFANDDPAQLRSLLRDLCDNGLVFSSGQGSGTMYRAASDDELQAFRLVRSRDGLDELVCAIVYRQGPISSENLADLTHFELPELEAALARLVTAGRLEQVSGAQATLYRTSSLYVPVGAPAGWEAAIFDHFQAMVKTICCRLREDRTMPGTRDTVGGSTFTIDVWPGHPNEEQVHSTLANFRSILVELRRQTDEFNAAHGIPEQHDQVVLYVGQCLIHQGIDDNE